MSNGEPAELVRPRRRAAAAWAAAVCLLRIDGIYFAGLVCLGAWLSSRALEEPGRSALARAAVRSGCAALLVVAAQALFRLAYHGHLVPHTMEVKVGLSALSLERGGKYLAVFLLSVTSLPILCWIGLREALRGRQASSRNGRSRDPRTLALLVPAFGGLLYPLLVGGDFMAMGRILLPSVAFFCLLLSIRLARARSASAALVVLLVGLSALPAFNLHPVPRELRERLHFRWNTAHYLSEYEQWRQMKENAKTWTILGKALAHRCERGDSLVAAAVGALGYYSDLWIYDQFGLASPEVVAHGSVPGRRSAGHDFFVPPEFFLHRNPTFLAAALVHAADRFALLPPSWLEGGELAERVRIEWYNLDRSLVALGAPASTLLRLARYMP
jgi:hypothetical protein